MTVQEAKEILQKIQAGTATSEECLLASKAFEIIKKSLFVR